MRTTKVGPRPAAKLPKESWKNQQYSLLKKWHETKITSVCRRQDSTICKLKHAMIVYQGPSYTLILQILHRLREEIKDMGRWI